MNEVERFIKCLKEKGYKNTNQRIAILQIFLSCPSHISLEEIYRKAREYYPNIGFATVYRTMKLLTICGIAQQQNFKEGIMRFERIHAGKHHDHMICLKCGDVIEFTESNIEDLQKEAAIKYDFDIEWHRLELYGYCRKCKKDNSTP